MSEVAFVGLGTMGREMARRLIEAGHDVAVWNRSPQAADDLVALGASRLGSVADAFARPLVVSMLANDDAARAQFTAASLTHAHPDAVHVNMATLSLDTTRDLAALHLARGVAYVAAPVLGRPQVAASGQLNIVAAGDAEAVARVQHLLDVIGKRTWVVGDEPAAASLVKIGVNYNLIHALQALAESVTLMEAGGVDGETFVEILTDAAFTGSVYRGYGPLIARREYLPPAFSVALGLKDLTLTEHAARQHGVALATAPALREVFERTLGDPELADLDWAAIAEITREDSGRR